jgi:hypothetical protein
VDVEGALTVFSGAPELRLSSRAAGACGAAAANASSSSLDSAMHPYVLLSAAPRAVYYLGVAARAWADNCSFTVRAAVSDSNSPTPISYQLLAGVPQVSECVSGRSQ